MHMQPSRKKGLVTGKQSPIKHGPEILQLPEAINLLKEVAVTHCRGQQKENLPEVQENKRADKEAKSSSLRTLPSVSLALFPFQG